MKRPTSRVHGYRLSTGLRLCCQVIGGNVFARLSIECLPNLVEIIKRDCLTVPIVQLESFKQVQVFAPVVDTRLMTLRNNFSEAAGSILNR